ncbi:uncharacterized protein LOC115334598 [Aquila chrysaetos chrysaetos]|uniref:uncharacterized protein LOC115334598 n=1 Tax=Aquila chrysaetos chrysaetos TaxID=223781 RepID=UPI001177287B|nr:uncharacterized protein LOC115334598 [Aquila chrysaetos chrysaetos]
MSLPATSKTSVAAPVAYTAGKAHSFCFPRDGEARAPLCSAGREEQPHKSACLVPGRSAFFSETDPARLAPSGSVGACPARVGGRPCTGPGTRSAPSPRACSEPQPGTAPWRSGILPWRPFPGQVLLSPAEQDDSALSGRTGWICSEGAGTPEHGQPCIPVPQPCQPGRARAPAGGTRAGPCRQSYGLRYTQAGTGTTRRREHQPRWGIERLTHCAHGQAQSCSRLRGDLSKMYGGHIPCTHRI